MNTQLLVCGCGWLRFFDTHLCGSGNGEGIRKEALKGGLCVVCVFSLPKCAYTCHAAAV